MPVHHGLLTFIVGSWINRILEVADSFALIDNGDDKSANTFQNNIMFTKGGSAVYQAPTLRAFCEPADGKLPTLSLERE
jgi:hypothetical protein